ncbi:actin cross-linking protein, partial [Tanacetum coccineum]
MEFFSKAKVVGLRSHLNKFLVADDDETTVRQSRNGSSVRARWTVEMVEGKKENGRLKLKSKDGKFLRANGGTPPWRNS